MKRNKLILFTLITILFLSCSSGIDIEIRNIGETSIEKIELIYSGGKIEIDDLKGYRIKEYLIKPKWESHIELKFIDFDGNQYSSLVDTYFEPGYIGHIIILIDFPKKIEWIEEIEKIQSKGSAEIERSLPNNWR